jgi:hypothetical protein
MKMTVDPATLCKGLPSEFSIYLNYCRNLAYETKPDYSVLRDLFRTALYNDGYDPAHDVFDWFYTPTPSV